MPSGKTETRHNEHLRLLEKRRLKAKDSLLLQMRSLCPQDHMRQVGEAQMERAAFHMRKQRPFLKVLHVEILMDDNDPRRSKAPMFRWI